MNWLTRLLRPAPRLGAAHTRAVSAWRALPASDLSQPAHALRCVAVDVETSGLDLSRDRLISIGAVAVSDGVIRFDESFEAVLRQEAPSDHGNILVHGIGGTTQITGRDAADALADFLGFAGKAPLIAFHAEFDKAMLGRALRETLGLDLANAWLDVAVLAPALFPERASSAHSLDDWMQALGVDNYARHDAVADALTTAQLFQIVAAQAARKGMKSCADLIALGKGRRWLGVR